VEQSAIILGIVTNLILIVGSIVALLTWAYRKKERQDKLDKLYDQLVPDNGSKCIMDRMKAVESGMERQDRDLAELKASQRDQTNRLQRIEAAVQPPDHRVRT
jgi:hypothetical protein